jgi:hypothetical protein
MSVRIPHRFIGRLAYTDPPEGIQVIILGSFNPGEPDMATLPHEHADQLRQLFSTAKYRRFSQVRNFYDRPPNRFWGVMDRIRDPATYEQYGQKFRNSQGLKFFKGGDRDAVFQRQQEFCREKGIFISDVVKAVTTTEFRSIYDNFSDTSVNNWATEFNTAHLLEILHANRLVRVLFNIKKSRTTPAINQELAFLTAAAGPGRIHWLPSTSGAAGNQYDELVPQWKKALSH